MLKFSTIILLLLCLCSCNYRVYVNDHHMHNPSGVSNRIDSVSKSYLTFDIDDKIPDSAIFINDTKILSPVLWLTVHSFDYCFIRHAKVEANRAGANCIKITNKRMVGKGFSRDAITVKMYKLSDAGILACRLYKDSASLAEKKKNEKFVIVNLASADGSYNIYYNDSLICTCLKPTKQKGSYTFHPQKITLDKPGILSLQKNGTNKYKAGIALSLGQEYLYEVTVAGSKHGPYFLKLKKDEDY